MATYKRLDEEGLSQVWSKATNKFADKETTETELNKKFELPSGGTTGQILTKTDSGTSWEDPSSGSFEVAEDSEFIEYTGLEINPMVASWSLLHDISLNINSDNATDYKNEYAKYVGNIRFIDVGSYKNVPFRLLGICNDTKSNGNPTFLSFVSEYVFEPNTYPVYPYGGANKPYPSYTKLRSKVQSYLSNFPADLQSSICEVTKIADTGNSTVTTYTDKVWPLHLCELHRYADRPERVYQYYENLSSSNTIDDIYYTKRSALGDEVVSYLSTRYGYYVDVSGNTSYADADTRCGFTLGFCV